MKPKRTCILPLASCMPARPLVSLLLALLLLLLLSTVPCRAFSLAARPTWRTLASSLGGSRRVVFPPVLWRRSSFAATTPKDALDDESAVSPQAPEDALVPTKNHRRNETSSLTSILLQVSYDGSHFSGWSAGNCDVKQGKKVTLLPPMPANYSTRSSRKRRLRRLYSADALAGVRSVQGILQLALAKLYGNVDPTRVVVEGASRTDKGVHAVGMVAHVYGLQLPPEEEHHSATTTFISTIPGKRLPHPHSSTDTNGFLPLPMTPQQLTFCLNRMLPPDVRIRRYAVVPKCDNTRNPVFHASTLATAKTYEYRVAFGPRADPTQARTTWYVGPRHPKCQKDHHHATSIMPPLPLYQHPAILETIQLLTAQAYNFSALSAVPRGRSDKAKRRNEDANLTCRIFQVNITPHEVGDLSYSGLRLEPQEEESYTIAVTADRFLYKMMRFLMGLLVGVARQQVTVAQVEALLQTDSHRKDLPNIVCAPAHGLVLQQVHYDNHPDLEWHEANS